MPGLNGWAGSQGKFRSRRFRRAGPSPSHASRGSLPLPVSTVSTGRATVMKRGSPVSGRVQGWRLAPPPAAASALTPSAHRAGWHPCGRRGTPTVPGRARSCHGSGGVRWVPPLAARHHGVEDDDQFAHAGDERHLGFLAAGAQPLVVGLDDWVVAGRGGQGCHVEQVADFPAPPLMWRSPLRSPLSSS